MRERRERELRKKRERENGIENGKGFLCPDRLIEKMGTTSIHSSSSIRTMRVNELFIILSHNSQYV